MVMGSESAVTSAVSKIALANEKIQRDSVSSSSQLENPNDITLPLALANATREPMQSGNAEGAISKANESTNITDKTSQLNFERPAERSLPVSSRIIKALDNALGSETVTVEHPLAATPGDLRCPNCDLAHRAGELVCIGCGIVFSSTAATHKLGTMTDLKVERVQYVGDAVTNDMRPITFQIDDELFTLPVCSSIVIGRSSSPTDPAKPRPDVDLNRFQAHINGVSRQHIRITREHDLVHIMDLGSSNGTYLNGFRLMPNQERLLRNGDELLLGRLRVRVQF